MITVQCNFKKTSCCSKNKETNTVCEPCSNEDKAITATHFCKSCYDPEPLCESCAKEHSRQKISKYHILCDKIEEFPLIKTKLWYVKSMQLIVIFDTTLNFQECAGMLRLPD